MTSPNICSQMKLDNQIQSLPRFQHDCEQCEYQGQLGDYDVYVCRSKRGAAPTLLARYGNDGSQYISRSADIENYVGVLNVLHILYINNVI